MIRVALLDAGVGERHAPRIAAACAFALAADGAIAREAGLAAATRGALPHGPALADVLLADPRVALLAARVFGETLATSAAQLAAALDWAVEQGAVLASVSAGLREPRDVLGDAVRRALARGVVLVAAAPARGAPVYPAAYPGVVRATGDARCAPGEWSWLASAQADFGAHVQAGAVRGASAGCARIAAQLAARLAAGDAPEAAVAALQAGAHYRGPERRA
jgi:hypothetical protein